MFLVEPLQVGAEYFRDLQCMVAWGGSLGNAYAAAWDEEPSELNARRPRRDSLGPRGEACPWASPYVEMRWLRYGRPF
jgi:hypothetical protein